MDTALHLLRVAAKAAWRRVRCIDPVTLVTVQLMLLFLLSARYVLPGLGGIGTPAALFAFALALLWTAAKLVPVSGMAGGPQPVRWGLFLYVCWYLLSYAVAHTGAMTAIAAAGSDRGVIALVAVVGVSLLVADGVPDLERLETLLRRMVILGAVIAVIGIIQFATPFDPAAVLRLPGLVENSELVTSRARADFSRPYATTLHAIEFGVVLAALMPIAITFALDAEPGRQRTRHLIALIPMAVAIPMSVSRSAVLGLAVGLLVVSTSWTWRTRLNVAAAGFVLTAALGTVVPGLLGTLKSLFANAESDPSIQGRVADYDIVKQLLTDHPMFGLGPGVFNPTDYLLLDNEYLYTSVSLGLPGALIVLLLIALPIVALWRVGRHATSPHLRPLSRAIMASLVVCAVALATFDGFSFRVFHSVFFVLVGVSGAMWRFVMTAPTSAGAASATEVRSAGATTRRVIGGSSRPAPR